jgi:hypothetical protein
MVLGLGTGTKLKISIKVLKLAKIKNITDQKKFRKALKTYLTNKPVYSLNEFFSQEL